MVKTFTVEEMGSNLLIKTEDGDGCLSKCGYTIGKFLINKVRGVPTKKKSKQ